MSNEIKYLLHKVQDTVDSIDLDKSNKKILDKTETALSALKEFLCKCNELNN